MTTNRRQFLAMLGLGVPVAVTAAQQFPPANKEPRTATEEQPFLPPTSPRTDTEGPAELLANEQPRRASHAKVLIVEDSKNERPELAELISAWGYRVETAADGMEGLEKTVHWSPSIIVSDLKMPRMGGMER